MTWRLFIQVAIDSAGKSMLKQQYMALIAVPKVQAVQLAASRAGPSILDHIISNG